MGTDKRCKHELSSMIMGEVMGVQCEISAEVLFERVCEDCGKILGREVQVFKYSHSKEHRRGD